MTSNSKNNEYQNRKAEEKVWTKLHICGTSKIVAFKFVAVWGSSSAVECRTRNQVSPGSNQFRRLGIFVLSIDAPAV